MKWTFPFGMIAAMGRLVATGFFITEDGVDFLGVKDIGDVVAGIGM